MNASVGSSARLTPVSSVKENVFLKVNSRKKKKKKHKEQAKLKYTIAMSLMNNSLSPLTMS